MKQLIALTAPFLLLLIACQESESLLSQDPLQLAVPNINVDSITHQDFMTWWSYHSYNIALESAFTPLDESANQISKTAFLEQLITGDFIPVKLSVDVPSDYYKLIRLDETAESSIRTTLKNTTDLLLRLHQMEGQVFPSFDFEDLDGNTFNTENTAGKILVLKCWFIACRACVAEFPELNELVEEFTADESIEFISLAFDTPDELQKFIERKPFAYQVVPEQRNFMSEDLGVSQYPTHFIIDETGHIEKVYTNAEDMMVYLRKKYQS